MRKVKAKNAKPFDHPLKSAVEAYLTANADNKDVSFDKIRADLSATSETLQDGALYQIAFDAGYKVEAE